MIEVRVPTFRIFEYQGSSEELGGGLRIYRDKHGLKPEVAQWFSQTNIPIKYQSDCILIIGQEWMTTFKFSCESEAAMFKLAWGGK